MLKMLTKSVKNNTQAMEIEILIKNCPPLPASWSKAAGLMRNKKNLLESHIKKIRREWDQ